MSTTTRKEQTISCEEERRNVCPACHYEGHIFVSKERALELDAIECGYADDELCLACEEGRSDSEDSDEEE